MSYVFIIFIFGLKLYMFRTVPLSIIRIFSLYTQQWCISYRFADSLLAGSGRNCSHTVNKLVWHKPFLRVQWKTPDDGQRNCPKHVEFYSKNKFEKLVYLVGFIIRNNVVYFHRALGESFITKSTECLLTKQIIFSSHRNYEVSARVSFIKGTWKQVTTFQLS